MTQYSVPSTWIDSTDDIVPHPKMGVVLRPTREMMDEAENEQTSHVKKPRKHKGGRMPLDLEKYWKGKYPSEREWMIAMIEAYGSVLRFARKIGCTDYPLRLRAAGHGIFLGRKRGPKK